MGEVLKALLEFIKKYGFVLLIIGGFTGIGVAVNNVVNWDMLTSFFVIIRETTKVIDFIWDTDTMFTIFGYSLSILTAYYSLKLVLLLRLLFND